jgi:cobyrinic acid a,c-diamide synthase
VILNHVGNPRHESTIVRAIERHCGIPVLGALPRDDHLVIRERHLGIVPLQEQAEAATIIDRIGGVIRQYTDVGRILDIARGADRLPRYARNDEGASAGSAFYPVIARSTATKQSHEIK